MDAVVRHFIEIVRRPVVVLLPAAEGLTVRYCSAELVFDKDGKQAASWVFENGQEAGRGAEIFSGSRTLYRPLKTGSGTVGVLGCQGKSSEDELPPDQRELLGIFLDQTALAIPRAERAIEAKRAEGVQEAAKLQKARLKPVARKPGTPPAAGLGAGHAHVGV